MGRAKVKIDKRKILLPYQERWVRDDSRLKICEKSRQIGWTWATAYRLVRNRAVAGASTDAWISSRDDLQAQLFLGDCKMFAKILQIGAEDMGLRVIDEAKNSAYVLRMSSGRTINSMSSNPDAQAGKRGDRVLDEFALHGNPRKLYDIAYPGITWGGSMEIFSSHRGTHNFFNSLIREIRENGNPKKFSLHRVTLEDALNQGLLAKLQLKLPADDERQEMDEAEYFDFIRSGCSDDEAFRQEYMCDPADDDSAFISYGEIDGCCFRPGYPWRIAEPQLAQGLQIYGGLDIGRKHDLTSFTAILKSGSMRDVCVRIDLEKTPFRMQKQILWPWFAVCSRIAIDATGVGMQLAEEAAEDFGKHAVEEIMFTAPLKEQLAYPLRAAFEDRSIRIPHEDDKLRSDIRKIRRVTSSSGNVRFVADSDSDGHADRFWGLALALHASRDAREFTFAPMRALPTRLQTSRTVQ